MEQILLPILVVLGGLFIWVCFCLTILFILIRLGTMLFMLKSGKNLPFAAFIWRMKYSQLSQPISPVKSNK